MPLRPSRYLQIPLVLSLLCACSPGSFGCGSPGSSDAPTRPPPAGETPPSAAGSPLVDLVTSAELEPYWHASLPGRVPVRIVANPNSTDRPAFQMLGAPVQWISPDQVAPGDACVTVDFQLVDGLLNLTLRYAVEGVRASAVYVPDGDGWARVGRVTVTEE